MCATEAPDAPQARAPAVTERGAPPVTAGAAGGSAAPSPPAAARRAVANGRYELVRELGRGGMGIVYEARDTALDRTVALKLLLPQRAAAARPILARFEREGKVLARVRHPGIVAVYDVGEEGGRPFLVVEYVAGGNLAAALEAGMPLRESVRVLRDVARALDAAHRAGVVHRDVKPENILLMPEGRARLSDFGLAVDTDDAARLTATGELLGTIAYMAPEQVEARPKAIGPATDIWALGVLLYEALCGEPPFLGETPMNTLNAIMRRELTPPSVCAPRTPLALERIAVRCLERDPARRPASAAEVADALDAFLRGEAATRPSARSGRRPVVTGVIALALAAAVVGGLAAAFTGADRPDPPDAAAADEGTRHEPPSSEPPSSEPTDARPWEPAPEQREAASALGWPVSFVTSVGLELVIVPAGSFVRDGGRQEVVITRPFYIARTEVTNAQARALLPDHDSGARDGLSLDADDQPAVNLSWTEAVALCGELTRRERPAGGEAFRLPTEAEWELAARAGASGRWPWPEGAAEDVLRRANLSDEATARALGFAGRGHAPGDDGHRVTAPVASFGPNRWGLHDVIGNVWEWCADRHAPLDADPRARAVDPIGPTRGSKRVLRGGAWDNEPGVADLSRRHSRGEGFRADSFGLRPVTAGPPPP